MNSYGTDEKLTVHLLDKEIYLDPLIQHVKPTLCILILKLHLFRFLKIKLPTHFENVQSFLFYFTVDTVVFI